ncbi:serine/threonine protein kinase [Roseofilum casamattae]|uniref:Serine/threonine-protein kinase n=1 Tax=Roseofilum casamattae BLCC-M143 TaxID=3022442 RepID=A0ABT7BYS3_9CYAN|nr:serine/threonine-protein kinase [Roseofilum casamattae]MDJ1184347.1 serine/threonine-protein kinase [Roseofilum casamattae BLCC-M143]
MLQPEQILSVPSVSSDRQQYQLHRTLGRTAAGRQTWLATDLELNEPVTLKLLAFNPQMEWDELKLFEREAQVLQALNHPRIPQYHNYFSLDREMGNGVAWFGLVQDYIPGASLQERLERGEHFTEEQVKAIADSVLQILIYLHGLSPPVLHRDIKPSNIILGDDEDVYLVDFGAVQSQGSVTGVTFTVVGTSGYAPLEQFWGRAVAASDLYALGATLIHLITGIAPVDLPHRDNRIQFSDRVDLNPHLVQWLEQMSEPAIEKRFGSAREAAEQLWRQPVLVQSSNTAGLHRTPKPETTLISVWRSPVSLQVHVPSRLRRNFVRTLVFSFIGLAMVRGILHGFIALMGHPLLLLLPFGTVMTILILYAGSHTQAIFEQNSFWLKRFLFRWNYLTQQGSMAQMMGVFIHHENYATQLKIHSQNYTGEYTYLIASGLTQNEASWLAREIQDWLYSRSQSDYTT